MRLNTVITVWILGAVLAVLFYAAGPDHVMADAERWVLHFGATLDSALRMMSAASFDLMRATALALLGVFLVLAGIAARRGLRARWALVAVPVTFLLLVGAGQPASAPRWFTALVLVLVGAAMMTRRLVSPNLTYARRS